MAPRGTRTPKAVLRKVADDRLVLATSGGSDWVCPSTTAVGVPGGYRLDGRKSFCTQAPVAGVISTSATLGEPGPDAVVLHAGVPLSAPGVSIVETWDTLGMRGHGEPRRAVRRGVPARREGDRRRPFGVLAGPLLAAAIHFAPVAGAAYLGVARGACDEAVRLAMRKGEPSPAAVRQSARCGRRLQVARWALLGAVTDIGDDPAIDEATLATVMTAKRHAVARRAPSSTWRWRSRAGRRSTAGPAGAGLPRRARRPVPPADPGGDAHPARRARRSCTSSGQYGRRGMITHSTR